MQGLWRGRTVWAWRTSTGDGQPDVMAGEMHVSGSHRVMAYQKRVGWNHVALADAAHVGRPKQAGVRQAMGEGTAEVGRRTGKWAAPGTCAHITCD